MADYLDFEKIDYLDDEILVYEKRVYDIGRCIKFPFEDVAPVIHAHWKIIYESSAGVTDARCSNCGFESFAYENDVHNDKNCHYCPCCGAKMDEEVEDA